MAAVSFVDHSMVPAGLSTRFSNPKTPWHVSQGLFDRVHKQGNNAGAGAKPFRACQVTSSDPEFALIMTYFNHSKPKNYGIKNVLFVHNPVLSKSFEAQIEQTEMGAKNFPASWKDEEPKQARAATISRWKKQSDQFSPIQLTTSHRSQFLVATRVIPLWHGTNKAEAICTSGFTFFGKHHLIDKSSKAGPTASTDTGYYGSGIYFTNSAQYASMYNADKVGGTILFALVSMREPYPVVSDIPSPHQGTDMRKLEGRGAYQNYNAHYIPVTSADPRDPDNMVYYPCHHSETAAWDEYVVFNTAQTLPQFQIELGVDFPASISPTAGPCVATEHKKMSTLKTLTKDDYEILHSKTLNGDLKAVEEIKTRAQAGIAIAQFYLGRHFLWKKDYLESFKWVKMSADQGYVLAQLNLGVMLEDGGYGVPKDKLQAMEWFKRAFELATKQSDPDTLFYLADYFQGSYRSDQEHQYAFKLFKLAAEQGHSKAQFGLGMMYVFGMGTDQNQLEATKWLKLAEANGDKDAKEWLKSWRRCCCCVKLSILMEVLLRKLPG